MALQLKSYYSNIVFVLRVVALPDDCYDFGHRFNHSVTVQFIVCTTFACSQNVFGDNMGSVFQHKHPSNTQSCMCTVTLIIMPTHSKSPNTHTHTIINVKSSTWVVIPVNRLPPLQRSIPHSVCSAGTRRKWRTLAAARSRCTAPSSTRSTRARSWSPTAARKRSTSRRPTRWSANLGWPLWSWPRPKQCKSRTMHSGPWLFVCVLSYVFMYSFVRDGLMHSNDCVVYFPLQRCDMRDRLSRCVIPYPFRVVVIRLYDYHM